MNKIRRRLFEIIQIGNTSDVVSKTFDLVIVVTIFVNLTVTILATVDAFDYCYKAFGILEFITIIIFTIEYILRICTADFLHPNLPAWKAVIAFVFSIGGLIDLLTFFPYYLPIMFPTGMVAFRMLRVIRIFKLFRINQKYDAFNVITDVLKEKKDQIISSICLILIVMIAASLCMYSLEHDAQPDAFKNAFSGIWWSVSTVLTVGYGDIYPITPLGKFMAIIISFLGVGVVAIPTGIISAGFVEQYTKVRSIVSVAEEHEIKFVTSTIPPNHQWIGKKVREIVFPPQLVLVAIIRDGVPEVVKGDTALIEDDTIVIGALNYSGDVDIHLKEIIVKEEHEWVGEQIKNLDISRQDLIVLIRRKNKSIIPNGNTVIKVGDVVLMYSREVERKIIM